MPDIETGLEELLGTLADELDIEKEVATSFMQKIKEVTPRSERCLHLDFKRYCNKLSEEGEEIDLNLQYKVWSMKWLATQLSLLSALLLTAAASGMKSEE